MKEQHTSRKSDYSTSIVDDTTTQKSDFVDKSPEALEAQRLQNMVDSSEESTNLQQWQTNIDQKQSQEKNKTGLPNELKAAIEAASGLSLDDVQVHYNSNKPEKIGAHAYAAYPNIYVAPGQEKYLAEEAWHIVQQLEGQVKGTTQKDGKDINTDKDLEKEAKKAGALAQQQTEPIQQEQELTKKTIQGGVAQLASLGDYIDIDKPEHDPGKLSDDVIRATDEYISWSTNYSNYVVLNRYTLDEVLLACRLAIREMREARASMDVSNLGEEYLQKARKQGSVADKAESFKDKKKWSRQNMSLKVSEFGKWILDGGKEPTGDGGILNCWEMVMYSAYKSNVLSKAEITTMYKGFLKDHKDGKNLAKILSNFDSLKKGNEYTYDKDDADSPKPLKGDLIVFKNFAKHVAIATGKTVGGKVEIMSLWTQNNKKTFKTTIEDLLAGGAASPVKFFTPNW